MVVNWVLSAVTKRLTTMQKPRKISYFINNNIKIKDVKCEGEHSLALDVNGNVYGFGHNQYGQCCRNSTVATVSTPSLIESFKNQNVVRIDAGYYNSLCVTEKNEYFMFGNNGDNECVAPKFFNAYKICNPYCVSPIIERQVNKNNDNDKVKISKSKTYS